MSEEQIEKEIQAKNLNAPRLTTALIDSKVKAVDYHVFPGSCLTVCCMKLANGFTVTGESACASPENFNAEIGKKIAFEQARNKIWMLEGYLLKQSLFETPETTFSERLEIERDELREKYVKLTAFFDTDIFNNLSTPEQDALKEQSEHMLNYVTVLDRRVSCSF